MKIKFMYRIVAIMAVAVLFSGCDWTYRLHTNNKRKLAIENECGKIKILSQGAFGSHYYFTIKAVSSDYEIDTDKIKIISANPESEMGEVKWTCKDKEVAGKILLKRGKKLMGEFHLYDIFDGNFHEKGAIVLPGDYIMCNGSPVQTDTLRIR